MKQTPPTASHYVKQALPEDEPAIRKLLRNAVIEGDIHITLEREPNANLAAQVEGQSYHTVLILDADKNQLIGMGSRSVRPLYVDGCVQSVGYLGQLRASPGHKGIKRLVTGFQAVSALRQQHELPYDITSIVADNTSATRLLERGLTHMPKYQKFAQLSTFIIPTTKKTKPPRHHIEIAQNKDISAIASCLQKYLRQYQFSPYWDKETLLDQHRCNNLSAQDFLIIRNKNDISSCLAIWDQQPFKQVVIKGYAMKVRLLRPYLNCLLKVKGKPTLPKVPTTMNMAYLSHLAIDNNHPEIFIDIINQARLIGKQRGLDYLVTGLTDQHPLHQTMLSKFPCYQYNSNLYRVHWNKNETNSHDTHHPIPHVEVALL